MEPAHRTGGDLTPSETDTRMKNICVYCGSSPGRLEAYSDAARALAKALVDRDLGLVYGGASVGLMGLVADSVLQLGGRVVGVIPEALAQKELAHKGLTELHVTASMHARKTLMAELSDGFIALPGGIGTLEEIFEIWTWAQLGFHAKPCGLLNVAGYYDWLTAFLDHAVAEQFVKPLHRSILSVEQEPSVLLDGFARYQAPSMHKWVDKDQT
jgi:uncharacterized protein (TIGR00730 family)